MSLFTRVVVAYDGSQGSQRALMLAIRLASDQEAALLILSIAEHVPQFVGTVGEVDEHVREQQSALRVSQERALRLAAEMGAAHAQTILEVGHAAQLIVAVAEREQADLLVLGRSGHSEVWGRFMGSTADKVTRHATCSVLVAH